MLIEGKTAEKEDRSFDTDLKTALYSRSTKWLEETGRYLHPTSKTIRRG